MKLLQIASLIALFAAVTAELKCYTCKKTLAGEMKELPEFPCLGAFIPEQQTSTPEDIPLVTCGNDHHACFKSISQTYQNSGIGKTISSYIISRGCLNTTASESELNSCEEGKTGQGYQSICYCTDSKCNSASMINVSFVTILFSSLVFAVLKLH